MPERHPRSAVGRSAYRRTDLAPLRNAWRGKTTVARALARRYPRAIAIEVDVVRDWVVSVFASPLDPWTAETRLQATLAYQSAGAMARLYADAGFAVAIDGVTTEPDVASYAFPFPPRKVLLRPSSDKSVEETVTSLMAAG